MKIDANLSLPIGPLDDDVVLEYDQQESLQRFAQELLDRNYPYRGFSDLLESQTSDEDRKRFLFREMLPRVYQYAVDPPSFMISPRFKKIQLVVRELDVPTHTLDKYFSRLWRAGDFAGAVGQTYREYQNYTVETFGLRIDSVPFTDLSLDFRLPNPKLPRYWLTSNFELIQIWRVRVLSRQLELFYADPSRPLTLDLPHLPFLEERWHPRHLDTEWIGGLRGRSINSSLQIARFYRDAKRILAHHKRKLGRPTGTTDYSPESFLIEAKRIYCHLWAKNRRRPGQQAVATAMMLSLSAFGMYWRATELPWHPPDWTPSDDFPLL